MGLRQSGAMFRLAFGKKKRWNELYGRWENSRGDAIGSQGPLYSGGRYLGDGAKHARYRKLYGNKEIF